MRVLMVFPVRAKLQQSRLKGNYGSVSYSNARDLKSLASVPELRDSRFERHVPALLLLCLFECETRGNNGNDTIRAEPVCCWNHTNVLPNRCSRERIEMYSKSRDRKVMGVRPPPSAPFRINDLARPIPAEKSGNKLHCT